MRAKFGSNGATYECESCIKRKDAGSSAKCSAAECDDCKSSLTLCNRCLQSSQDTLKHSSQVSSASLATSTNSSSTTNTITTSTTTGLIGPTKFEIGQFEDENVGASAPLHSSSTETSEDELILRLNVLQKQLTDRDSSPSPSSPPNANKTDVLYARFDPKKPRPKSELIAELISLEEDINDSWDGIDLKRHSVHESMSYYSLCFPSPSYAAAPTATTSKPTPSSDWMPNLTKATLRNPTAGVQRTPKQARPKSYQPDGPIVHSNGSSIVGNGPTKSTSPPTQQTIATTSNVMANQSNQNESLADSFTMESISHSMSQSSGYQSLLDECDSSSFSALGSQSIQHRKPTSSCTTLRRNGQPVLTSAHAQQYSQRDCNSFDAGLFALPVETAFAAADSLEQLESTSSISSSNTTHNCASFASYASNRLPNSISGGLELTLDSAAQHRLYQRSYQFRPLPRAFSLDKKLSSARTVSNPLWTRFHAIKEVIAPSSPALRKKLHKSVTHKFVRRRFVRSTGKDELQLAMYVFGGQTATNHCQPLSVWKLYV